MPVRLATAKIRIGRKTFQEWVEAVTTISWGSRTGLAPLQEISSNEAQTILMTKITNLNMARNLAKEKAGCNTK
jgi:hypothetical protein